ncbi:hypothetical protein ABT390_33930 [Streptomyces aurantiacus]|uniref:Uncharacterized protein n=1 Tax=Streptomyces aurantiacus JA 4570 TaxID=1286094 RepID=S4AZV4_9ACTN|nr:hypothetical protein [Streptomyces aurantiacus]EPH46882.1 hypothetical protein STRAU_0048 [Streptomyces aurantiacus JA 4570]
MDPTTLSAADLFTDGPVLVDDPETSILILNGHHTPDSADRLLASSAPHAWWTYHRTIPATLKVTFTLFTRHHQGCDATGEDDLDWCGCAEDTSGAPIAYHARPANRLARGALPVTWIYTYSPAGIPHGDEPDYTDPATARAFAEHLREHGWFSDACPHPAPPGQLQLAV